jgi:hypothetical protein
MAGTQDKKQQIAGDLAKARMQAHEVLLLLRRYLDVRQRIAQSIQHYPWEWVTTGFICGWLLSRLPARKKKDLHLQRESRADQNGMESTSAHLEIKLVAVAMRIWRYAQLLAERLRGNRRGDHVWPYSSFPTRIKERSRSRTMVAITRVFLSERSRMSRLTNCRNRGRGSLWLRHSA